MIWWWREDDLLGAKLASFVLLFGSPLDSRWPGVGSPGCRTVKTFLGEDATLLKLPVGVFRASSSSWCCCGMELCVLHSFSSHRMRCNCFCHFLQLELSLRYLVKYDTSVGCGECNVSCSDLTFSVSVASVEMWISVCVQLQYWSLVPRVQWWQFRASFLVAVCVLLLWTLDAAVFVENSVDKHFGVIIVITNCRSKELTTTVMLNGEGIFFELEFYIIRNFTERTLTHSHHHVTLLRHNFCRY